MPLRRRSSKLRAEDPLDKLCRRVVMVRAGAYEVEDGGRVRWYGNCQLCGNPDWLYWCHYFTRGIKRVKHDIRNSWAFCSRCHYIVDEVEPRHRFRTGSRFTDFVIEKIGQQEYETLCMLAVGKDAEGRPVACRYLTHTEIRMNLEYHLACLMNGGGGAR